MKKIILLYIFLSVFLNTLVAQKEFDNVESSDYFKVDILQNGKIVIPDENGVIKLKKLPFKFKLTLYKKNGVDVSASWGKYYYDYPDDSNIYECKDNTYLKGCRFVAVKTGSQDKFNVERDLAVGDGSYQQHWFYNVKMDWHRFDDNVKVEKGVIYAEMSVENIYDCDLRDTRQADESEYAYPINNIDKDIYMVFAVRHYESGMEHPKELQREKFVLRFIE